MYLRKWKPPYARNTASSWTSNNLSIFKIVPIFFCWSTLWLTLLKLRMMPLNCYLFTLPVLSNLSICKASAPLYGLAHANNVSVLDKMYRHLVGTVSQFLFCIMRIDLYLSRIPIVFYLHFIYNKFNRSCSHECRKDTGYYRVTEVALITRVMLNPARSAKTFDFISLDWT